MADDGLEVALRNALGSMRRFSVRRGARRRREPREAAEIVIVTWARHLTSRARFLAANREEETACLVLVEPNTPVEALSETSRLCVSGRSVVLFVRPDELGHVNVFLLGFVKRLSLADKSERILHAWWMDGALRVLTTEYRRLEVPRRSIPELRGRRERDCAELETPLRGSGIVWPRLELALGFDEIARRSG